MSTLSSTASAVPSVVREPGPWARAFTRLRRNPAGLISGVVLILLALLATLAPLIAPYAPSTTHFDAIFQRPGTVGFLLGTDDLGRDLLSRALYGLRVSLEVGALAVLVALIIGVPLGVAAGVSRAGDLIIGRVTDVTLAFPFLLIAVLLTAITGPSMQTAAIAIGISHVPTVIRVVRVETLSITRLDYMVAARLQGVPPARVFSRYLVPNSTSAIIVQASVIFPTAVLAEAILSFLGLGIQPPTPSLGGMLSDAQQYTSAAPWAPVIPGIAIMLICLSFNIFGDALRDALDVRAAR